MRVFVSIAPERWLVEQLGGELVETRVLLDKGQEPHTYQPTPENLTALFRSRLYFTVGMEFEREIQRKIESNAGVRVIDVTVGIKKIPMVRHDHKHDHKHDRDQHEEAGHRNSNLDPHVWLDPRNLQKMASIMAMEMAAADSKNTAVYQRNLQRVNEKLIRLHQDVRHQLAPFKGTSFFVFHPAFGYFAHAYGLRQEPVEIEGKSPTPKQLYALVRRAKADQVKVLFVQPQFDRKNARAVAQAVGGKLAELDPLAKDPTRNL
ncbi:MAG: ABC transporter substrate-binding protein, partial [Candidatus Electrothrix sp. AR4]|nr:ABC transporter substrate-binding protein [Candidatus Electrothrix sp. AR4]